MSLLNVGQAAVCEDADIYSDLPNDPDELERLYQSFTGDLSPLIDETYATKTLYEALILDPEASQFAKHVDKYPALLSMLQDTSNEHTVFLPLDSGWKADQEIAISQDVLAQHISPHYVTAAGLLHMPNIATTLQPTGSNGPQVVRTRLTRRGNWSVNRSARILRPCKLARNGVIHTIDQPLVPPSDALSVLEVNGLTILRKAIRIAGLESAFTATDIKGRTIFAPKDEAFQRLGEETLAFLFDSQLGGPYLQALLKMHFCPNITFFSNLIWPKNNTGARQTSAPAPRNIRGRQSQIVQTMLTDESGHAASLTVGIARFNALIALRINDDAKVVLQDLPANDGVVQVIDHVLMPLAEEDVGETTLASFRKRWTRYVTS